MKNLLRNLTAAVLIAVAAVGCSNSKKADRQADTLTFACEKYDTVAYYSKDPNSPKCSIDIKLHYAMGPNAHIINDSILKCGIFLDKELRRGEKKTVPKAIRIVARNHIKGFKNDVREVMDDGGNIECMSECYYGVESRYSTGYDSIINYVVSCSAYLGGAHGTQTSYYLNFDPESGRMYRAADITAPGAGDRLAQTIALRIARNHGCKTVEELTDREGIFGIFEPYVPDNMILGRDSIVFVYQSEEVGPYAVGEIKAGFAYSELKGLINIGKQK